MTATSRQQQIELVRLLYLEHGHQKASELSNVRYDLVRQWASRYGWKQDLSQNVTKQVADRVQDELAEAERETRISLARSFKRMSKDCEELPAKDANVPYTVAKGASIVHKWDQKEHGGNTVVNIALLGVDPSTVQAQVVDVESVVSE